MLTNILQSCLGLLCFLGIAWAMSERRRDVPLKAVAAGVGAQLVLALVTLRLPFVRDALAWLSKGVDALKVASDTGARFMFGYLSGGPTPYEVIDPGSNFVVAFQVLPIILVVSALSALLFHVGALPFVISLLARALRRTLGVSGPLGFAAASSVFLGIIESPLLVKPYIERMSRADLFALMTCGMSTIAGTVLVLYSQVVEPVVPGATGHMLVASVISVPAALAVSLLMIPPDPEADVDETEYTYDRGEQTAVEAVLGGIKDGVKMIVDIAAIIIVLFALVSLVNQALALVPHSGESPWTLQSIAAWPMRPLVWLVGVPWSETAVAAELMATKTILNEFVAYLGMAGLPEGALSERSRLLMTYAMCGFANLGSLGILAGGLGAIAPERRAEIVGLAARALVAGTLTTLMTGAVIGAIHA